MSESILVAERNSLGHRLSYVRLLVGEGQRRGYRMRLALPAGALASREYALYREGLDCDTTVVDDPMSTRDWVRSVARVSVAVGAQTVIVPDGDHFLAWVGLEGRWNSQAGLVGLVLRDPIRYCSPGPAGLLRARSKGALLARAGRAAGATVLRLTGQAGPMSLPWVRDPIAFAPDPAVVHRLTSELESDRHWLAVLGRVDRRKSVGVVAAAATRLCQRGLPIGLLIRGACDLSALEQAEPAFEVMRRSGGLVVIDDRLISDAELDSTVAGADCLVVAHTNEGPSGLVGKALAAGTRFVVGGARSLQPDVELSSAAAWAPLEAGALADAMGGVLMTSRPAPVAVADDRSFAGSFFEAAR